MISYAILNLFAFGLSYFKVLGFSYVLMQTAVENNYIPTSEMEQLNKYLDDISSTYVLDNALIITKDPDNTVTKDATVKRQYGEEVYVGVSVHYRFIWPLTPKDQLSDTSSSFVGMTDNNFSGFASTSVLEARRKAIEDNVQNNILFEYRVPGLKYYPDIK